MQIEMSTHHVQEMCWDLAENGEFQSIKIKNKKSPYIKYRCHLWRPRLIEFDYTHTEFSM